MLYIGSSSQGSQKLKLLLNFNDIVPFIVRLTVSLQLFMLIIFGCDDFLLVLIRYVTGGGAVLLLRTSAPEMLTLGSNSGFIISEISDII